MSENLGRDYYTVCWKTWKSKYFWAFTRRKTFGILCDAAAKLCETTLDETMLRNSLSQMRFVSPTLENLFNISVVSSQNVCHHSSTNDKPVVMASAKSGCVPTCPHVHKFWPQILSLHNGGFLNQKVKTSLFCGENCPRLPLSWTPKIPMRIFWVCVCHTQAIPSWLGARAIPHHLGLLPRCWVALPATEGEAIFRVGAGLPPLPGRVETWSQFVDCCSRFKLHQLLW